MMKILVVEDEAKLMRVLTDFLVTEGYTISTATDGESGLSMAISSDFDLILLDIMLPRKSGFDVCKELRAQGCLTPIIMLTAKGQEVDKVLGLELGADDYVTKPFGLTELNARIRAVLRRYKWTEGNGTLDYFTFGEVEADFRRYEIRRNHNTFPLSSMEVALLQYLICHKGEVVSRETILNEVWGYDSYPTTRTIDTHILNLRKKIETDPSKPVYLLTIHGTGYKFVV